MSDLILNALRRKLEQANQASLPDLAKRLDVRIAERIGGDPPPAAESDDLSDDLADQTKAELLELATEREIEGRYQMNKAELVEALKET